MTKHIKRFFSVTVIGLSSLGIGWAQALAASAHEAHDHQHHAMANEHDFDDEFALAQPSQEIVIEQCWVRWLPGDVPAAGYFELQNNKETPIELLAARSPAYELMMLHQSYEDDGLLKMKMADAIIIPAQDSLSFVPGGYHMMLEEPTETIQVGERISVDFLFTSENKENYELVNSECRINPPKARQYDEQS
ncbi:MAG TPA: copper chaperone PCu(A)C [Paenalcaligenes sp.]|nr:copper chaperone PCu(A)C [Paenalcaligenes sp.]